MYSHKEITLLLQNVLPGHFPVYFLKRHFPHPLFFLNQLCYLLLILIIVSMQAANSYPFTKSLKNRPGLNMNHFLLKKIVKQAYFFRLPVSRRSNTWIITHLTWLYIYIYIYLLIYMYLYLSLYIYT